MNTAVIISGQMRTFENCFHSQRWQVYRHYEPNIHFFVSCSNDNNAPSAELLKGYYRNLNIDIDYYDDPTDLPEIPLIHGQHAPYANAASHRQLMLQHWGNKRAWEFFKSVGEKFSTIIRMRPDNFFHRFTPPNLDFAQTVHVPWWGKFGGINDRFAVMGPVAAAAYFQLYDDINILLGSGCPFHPESLLAACLEFHGIKIKSDLLAHFSTMRVGGQRFPEVLAEDLAELIAYGR